MSPEPRSLAQRRRDALHRFEHDIDCWVATADPTSGSPYLVPLSFLWRDELVLVSTSASSITGRNLLATERARLGLGQTRDVIMVEGAVEARETAEISAELGDAFAAKSGFDPRALRTRYLYFAVRPRRIQAWREENELAERDLMRDGRWLV